MTWWKIPLPPKTANKHYGTRKHGGKFLLREMVVWRSRVASAVSAGPSFHGGRYTMYMIMLLPDRRRRDTSNYLKVIEDALQKAGVLDDDNRIVHHVLYKQIDPLRPGLLVALEEFGEELFVDDPPWK